MGLEVFKALGPLKNFLLVAIMADFLTEALSAEGKNFINPNILYTVRSDIWCWSNLRYKLISENDVITRYKVISFSQITPLMFSRFLLPKGALLFHPLVYNFRHVLLLQCFPNFPVSRKVSKTGVVFVAAAGEYLKWSAWDSRLGKKMHCFYQHFESFYVLTNLTKWLIISWLGKGRQCAL